MTKIISGYKGMEMDWRAYLLTVYAFDIPITNEVRVLAKDWRYCCFGQLTGNHEYCFSLMLHQAFKDEDSDLRLIRKLGIRFYEHIDKLFMNPKMKPIFIKNALIVLDSMQELFVRNKDEIMGRLEEFKRRLSGEEN